MKIKIMKSLLSVAILAAMTNGAFAAGTAANTDIDNTATITYDVSGITQTPIGSSEGGNTSGAGTPTTFKVDRKIDLTVADVAPVTVTPGANNQNITYTLQNTGNSTEYFKLAVAGVAGDTFDATTCSVLSVAPGTLTATKTVQLTADQTTTVTAKCNIPLTATNTQTSNIDLSAAAVTDAAGGTVYSESATDTAGVDTVLADGDAVALGDTNATDSTPRDATFSAVNNYVISTASLKVTKISTLISDPINAGSNPKRIPGAVIKYTITVENTGAAATNLVVKDILEQAGINDGVSYATSPAACAMSGDAVVAPTCSDVANTITSTGFSLPDGSVTAKTETMTFYVKVD
jgi:hypothetical protein